MNESEQMVVSTRKHLVDFLLEVVYEAGVREGFEDSLRSFAGFLGYSSPLEMLKDEYIEATNGEHPKKLPVAEFARVVRIECLISAIEDGGLDW